MLKSKKSETNTRASPRGSAATCRTFQPLKDRAVWVVKGDGRIGHDVVGEVGVDGARERRPAGLHVSQELDQSRPVIALRKALSPHEPVRREYGIARRCGGEDVERQDILSSTTRDETRNEGQELQCAATARSTSS